jgi:DNA processing protein
MNSNLNEVVDTLVLARIGFYNLPAVLSLYKHYGSAQQVIAQRDSLREALPSVPRRITEALDNIEAMRERAAEEIEWDRQHDIDCICYNDSNYPTRLLPCPDAPLALFFKGTADLNSRHIINIVGTRHCTQYGADIIERLVNGLHEALPQMIIVSGLAYGVDIHAHRAALARGLQTVGVLAHGLDDLYPPMHRQTAIDMLSQGGLITEFMSHTNADKFNFVRRNRITAGLCDATVVVESARKGGGLITARIAHDYNRDVFAFPGAVGAPYSEGCNNLIRDQGAQLITSADDLIKAMGWEKDIQLMKAREQGIERNLFPDLSEEEQRIVTTLRQTNDLLLNVISVKSGLPVAKVTSLLFGLEMKGIVKSLAGGSFHLIG